MDVGAFLYRPATPSSSAKLFAISPSFMIDWWSLVHSSPNLRRVDDGGGVGEMGIHAVPIAGWKVLFVRARVC